MRRGKEGENNNGRGRREKERQTHRQRERERKKMRADERTNQCGRFASLYTVRHEKLMARDGEKRETGARS